MKIRNGFVSNSSSSSFVIDSNKYTCVDVALHAIEKLNNSESDIDYSDMIKNLNKLTDKNSSIYIECYDDIRIAKSKKKEEIRVEATWHVEFDFDCINQEEEGHYYKFFKKQKFYFPRYNNKIRGRKIYNFDIHKFGYKGDYFTCECDTNTWILIDGREVMCPKCGKDPNGRYVRKISRKKKINNINGIK